MRSIFAALGDMPPLLVWGLFPRLLGVIYFIAIASLFHQVVPIAGSRGIHPIKDQLRKIRADYPSPRRFLYFPTLFWLRADDWCLRALVVVGAGASLWAVHGGPWSNLALLLCWLVFLSFNPVIGLTYPWDCLLLEAGFLALFLPATNALPDFSAAALPLPAVGWAYRWLLFRLVLGFGKFKFLGTNRKEMGYLKSFLVAMPLPNYLGWYAYHLPTWFLKVGVVALFLVEVPVPFLIFVTGEARVLAALAIAALMVAIQLTGNWGFFNLLAIALCVPLLDAQASIWDQSAAGIFYPLGHLLTHLVVLTLFVGGLVYLPFNSWCTQAWLYWPSLVEARPAWVRGLLNCYRALAPFRIVHAYGVFPPSSGPPMKFVPIIEGTRDGVVWKEYHYRFAPSEANSAPVCVAPYHPRLDHNIFYEAFGNDPSNFLGTTFGLGNPYNFSRSSGLARIVQRLLEGNSQTVKLFKQDPFPEGPPAEVRVNLYTFEPTGRAERAQTGAWWRRRYIGPHLPAARLAPMVWEEWLPGPELFHWDEIVWKRRAPETRALMDLARSACGPGSALAVAPGITAEDVRLFWNAFVARAGQGGWESLPLVVRRARGEFSPGQLRVFERILGRLSLALLARLEPYYLAGREPKIRVETFFHLGMLIHRVIGEGEQTFEAVFRDPGGAAAFADGMTNENGLFLMGVFWHDKLVYHARKFRLLLKFHALDYEPGLPGFVMLIPFLREQFEIAGEERYPRFARKISDGEWFLVDDRREDEAVNAAKPHDFRELTIARG